MSSNGNGTHEILKPRAEWIVKRKLEAARTGDNNMSQMHFARQGQVTEEMAFVAEREKIPVALIRDEIAAGRLIIPANINHPELEPMGIGVATRCKINANIGNSAVTSNIREELDKLHTAVSFGADTVMDLSTGGNIPEIREAILRHSPVPIGTVPIYEALNRVKKLEDLNIDVYLEVIEEQARARSGLLHRARRRADPVCAHGGQAHHRHRQPWRRDSRAMDDPSPSPEFSL